MVANRRANICCPAAYDDDVRISAHTICPFYNLVLRYQDKGCKLILRQDEFLGSGSSGRTGK